MATKGNLFIMLITLLMLGHQTSRSGNDVYSSSEKKTIGSKCVDTTKSKPTLNVDNIKLIDSIKVMKNKVESGKDSCFIKLTKLKKQQQTIIEKTEAMVNLNKKN